MSAVSKGLRQWLPAAAAFAAYWPPPGLVPEGFAFNIPALWQCFGLRESGEAAVGVGSPRKRWLKVFLIEQRSCGFV